MRGGRRTVRVFWDHCHDWPLWEIGEKFATEPSDYDLSASVVALLEQWGEAFAAVQMDPDTDPFGVPDLEDVARERALARQAVAVLCREMPPDVEVIVDDARPGPVDRRTRRRRAAAVQSDLRPHP